MEFQRVLSARTIQTRIPTSFIFHLLMLLLQTKASKYGINSGDEKTKWL
jgi:hypothetical protein